MKNEKFDGGLSIEARKAPSEELRVNLIATKAFVFEKKGKISWMSVLLSDNCIITFLKQRKAVVSDSLSLFLRLVLPEELFVVEHLLLYSFGFQQSVHTTGILRDAAVVLILFLVNIALEQPFNEDIIKAQAHG